MPSEMEFVNFKDFVDRLPAADDFATGDKTVLSGATLRKMDKDVQLQKTAENALGSIHSLSDTATDADLVAGNYLVLNGSAVTKKLPANIIKKLDDGVNDLKNDKANVVKTYSELVYTINSGAFIDVKTYSGSSYSSASARNIVMTSGFTAGDTIYVSGRSVSSASYGLIGFFDSSHNSLGYYFEANTSFTRKKFVIPSGTAEIRVNGFGEKQPAIEIISSIKNLSNLAEEQAVEKFFSSNAFDRIEELQKSCPFSININRPVISFVFDDTMADVKDVADLFKEKGLACCFATVPSMLGDYIRNSNSVTRGEALLDAQSDGCEILVHGFGPMSSESTDAEVYNLFVGNKIKLVDYGFSVDGIIELGSGGGEKTFDYKRCEKYLKDLYRYSDYYGTGLNLPQYYTNNRVWMTSDLNENKSKIDNIVNNNSWKLLSAHAVVDGIGLSVLSDTIDYAVSEGCEIITMRRVYDKYSNR